MLIFFQQCLIFIYFVKKNNRRLEFNDTVFLSFVSIKEARNGYKGSGGHVFFAKYNFNLSYIFIKQNPIFQYIFCQKWLDTLALSPSYSNYIFFKTFFTVSNPKITNSRMSDCYLNPTQQFSAMSWREQVHFQ